MKAVLIWQKGKGDYIVMSTEIPKDKTFTIEEIQGAITLRDYNVDREIRALFYEEEPVAAPAPAPEAKDEIPF
ncbi:MAG: hypothetical protein M0Z38_02330 [Deltaproteobacteria bacterium]|nr:hypothetical protein [Deltaproteobacteria bacterium]